MSSGRDDQVYFQELATFCEKLFCLVMIHFFPAIKTNPYKYDSNAHANAFKSKIYTIFQTTKP